MTDHTECQGPVDADGYCDLHGFKKIGDVSSDIGCIAIIDIGAGPAVTAWFKDLCDRSGIDRRTSPLVALTAVSSHEVSFPGWKGMNEEGVVINTEQFGHPIYARYCDLYGTGHMSICELRIDLHHYEHLDEDVE